MVGEVLSGKGTENVVIARGSGGRMERTGGNDRGRRIRDYHLAGDRVKPCDQAYQALQSQSIFSLFIFSSFNLHDPSR